MTLGLTSLDCRSGPASDATGGRLTCCTGFDGGGGAGAFAGGGGFGEVVDPRFGGGGGRFDGVPDGGGGGGGLGGFGLLDGGPFGGGGGGVTKDGRRRGGGGRWGGAIGGFSSFGLSNLPRGWGEPLGGPVVPPALLSTAGGGNACFSGDIFCFFACGFPS